jgi:hypothetical protein
MALLKDARATAEAAGARRAAVLMVSVDQETAARLMSQLDKPEQERIATEIVRLESSPPERGERERVLREFSQFHLSQQAVESGGLRTAQSLLEKIHEPQEARHDAGLELAELVRRTDEHRGDGAHPTADRIRRFELHQELPHEHAHHVPRAEQEQRRERQDEYLR